MRVNSSISLIQNAEDKHKLFIFNNFFKLPLYIHITI